jgi:hypothetical protein
LCCKSRQNATINQKNLADSGWQNAISSIPVQIGTWDFFIDDNSCRIGVVRKSFDTSGLRFQKLSSDFFRTVLGLGAGDLKETAAGGHGGQRSKCLTSSPSTAKCSAIDRLISVTPERIS